MDCTNSIQKVLAFLLLPAHSLEGIAFGEDDQNDPIVSNGFLRHLMRRVVCVVAPIFHLYETGINCLRGILYCVAKIEILHPAFEKSEHAFRDACLSLGFCFSSILEIPQKLIWGSEVSYSGSDHHRFTVNPFDLGN